METLQTILGLIAWTGLTGAAAGAAAFKLLSAKVEARIKADYDKQLEILKAGLKNQNDLELERLRSQLSMSASERNIVLSNLQSRRGEVIAEIYEKLKRVILALSIWTEDFDVNKTASDVERATAAHEAGISFQNAFGTKAIFLPKTTAEKLEKVAAQLRGLHNRFALATSRKEIDHAEWARVSTQLNILSKEPIIELEAELRELLGDAHRAQAAHAGASQDVKSTS